MSARSLAPLYSLLDMSGSIGVKHLKAALVSSDEIARLVGRGQPRPSEEVLKG
jgi:hypothetical protein